MSANLIVDLGNTANFGVSIPPTVGTGTSGVFIGNVVDLKDANTLTNAWVVGGASSGVLVVQIQQASVGSPFRAPAFLAAVMHDPGNKCRRHEQQPQQHQRLARTQEPALSAGRQNFLLFHRLSITSRLICVWNSRLCK